MIRAQSNLSSVSVSPSVGTLAEFLLQAILLQGRKTWQDNRCKDDMTTITPYFGECQFSDPKLIVGSGRVTGKCSGWKRMYQVDFVGCVFILQIV